MCKLISGVDSLGGDSGSPFSTTSLAGSRSLTSSREMAGDWLDNSVGVGFRLIFFVDVPTRSGKSLMRERESKAVNANYFGNFYTSLLSLSLIRDFPDLVGTSTKKISRNPTPTELSSQSPAVSREEVPTRSGKSLMGESKAVNTNNFTNLYSHLLRQRSWFLQ